MSNILSNGLLIPFKMYNDVKYQDRKKSWVKSQIKNFDLICPRNRLLPFQCVRLNSPYPIREIELVNADTEIVVHNLLGLIDPTDLGYYIFEEKDYFIYYGKKNLLYNGDDFNLPLGNYYLRISDWSFATLWVSEVFTVKNFTTETNNCYVKLTYCSCSPLDDIIYGTNTGNTAQDFKNVVYLDTDIGEPKYKVDEVGYEDQNKIFHPTSLKHTKTYRLETVLPEYMVDALSIVPLHEVVYLTLPNGKEAQIKEIKLLETKWFEASNIAQCTVEFTEAIIVKTGCCSTNMDEVALYDEQVLQGYNTVANSNEYLDGTNSNNNGGLQVDQVDLKFGDLVLVFDDDDRRVGRLTRFTYPDPENGRPSNMQCDETNYVTVLPANDTEGTAIFCMNDNITYLRIIQEAPAESYWSNKPVMKSVDLSEWGEFGGNVSLRAVIYPNSVGRFFYIPSTGEPTISLTMWFTQAQCLAGFYTAVSGSIPQPDPRFYVKCICYNRDLGESEPMP